MSKLPGRKKKKTTPKNLEWTGLNKSLATTFQTVKSKDVPPEFETATKKVKELQSLLNDMQKQCRSYDKTVQAFGNAGTAVVSNMTEFVESLSETDILATLLSEFHPLIQGFVTNLLAFKEHMKVKLHASTDTLINEHVSPARISRKRWEDCRVELDVTTRRVDSMLRSTSIDPVRMFVAMSQCHFSNIREKQSFDFSTDSLGDTLWIRDFSYLRDIAELLIQMHECFLKSYTIFYNKEAFRESIKEQIALKREQMENRLQFRAQERQNETEQAFEDRYVPLVLLLSSDDLALVNAISVTAGSEQEQILGTVIKILDAYKKTLPIIELTIVQEVEKTTSSSTLFRGNSCATKLMSQFTKMTGKDYLFETMQDLIQEVIDNPAGYEVDETKSGGENVEHNMNKLIETTTKFLDAIVNSIDRCPVQFKTIANYLRTEMVNKFPDAVHTSVGGFIFLRFFCPAILAPESHGLVEGVIDPMARRPLILISKALQNIANGLLFGGKKEPFMLPMNEFIQEKITVVEDFFDQLAVPSDDDYDPLCSYDSVRNNELPKLHKKIVQNLEKITNSLNMYHQEDMILPLCTVLGDLGEVNVEIEPLQRKKKKK
eukprot:TRINITY_DN3691_c4_g2_i1.p1 TRINITY_DN3691_c4_g2~~TRINITY_DN3691_c4_g2_i1.p1  ORF type:complete len:619 (-),score=134.90 TRINITY_DN3691_c4_g2_i1:69-1877(-)